MGFSTRLWGQNSLKKEKEAELGMFSVLSEQIRTKAKKRRITRRNVERAIKEIRRCAKEPP
jgi:hypothetical protein